METRIKKALAFYLILLFSLPLTEIFELPPVKEKVPLPSEAPQPQQTQGRPPWARQRPAYNSQFPRRATLNFDKSAFLKSFHEQSGGSLLNCLKETELESPIFLTATLLKRGKLTQIRRLSFQKLTDLPPCLEAALEQMTFSSTDFPSSQESIDIQWSLEF